MADTKTLIEQAYSAFNKRHRRCTSTDDGRRELAQGFGGVYQIGMKRPVSRGT